MGKAEKIMLTLAIVCVALLFGSIAIGAEPAPKKVYVVYVGASWCPPCRAMKANTLTDPSVIKQLKKFDGNYVLDLDQHSQYILDKRMSVSVVPTIMIGSFNKDREWVEIDRRAGYMSPESFLFWLRANTPNRVVSR